MQMQSNANAMYHKFLHFEIWEFYYHISIKEKSLLNFGFWCSFTLKYQTYASHHDRSDTLNPTCASPCQLRGIVPDSYDFTDGSYCGESVQGLTIPPLSLESLKFDKKLIVGRLYKRNWRIQSWGYQYRAQQR